MTASWRQIVPNIVTLAAMACAFGSILAAGNGQYILAAQLIMACLILDGLDGNIARLVRGETKFGAELDTFVDITAYGIAPAVLIHEVAMKHHGVMGLIFVILTVMSGATRLSRFRVADPDRGNKGFTGLPITLNASWVAMFVFITETKMLNGEEISLVNGPLAALVWASSLVFLMLQVSNVKYGKPSKTPLFFFGGIIMVVLLFAKVEIAVASALAILGYAFFYAFISPFLPKHADALDLDEDEEEDDDETPVHLRHS